MSKAYHEEEALGRGVRSRTRAAMASSERIFKLVDTAPTVPDTGHVHLQHRHPVEIRFGMSGSPMTSPM